MDLHLSFEGYTTHQHSLKDDYEGRVVTTLIESTGNREAARQTVLYIHGFNDYFFQNHVMRFYNDYEVDFYALDLRKCGRSLKTHQHPNYCRDMKEYFEDLDYAISFIFNKNKEVQLFLLGHSTGGLLVSYYALEGNYKQQLAGLILNSPFFEFNLPLWLRKSIPFLLPLGLKLAPYGAIRGGVSSVYGKSLLQVYGGEWSYDVLKKPIESFPAYLAWIRAVYKVQKIIQNTPELRLPVLLMHADRSSRPKEVNDLALHSDVVLNVKDMERIGLKMGKHISHCVVAGGMHDLFLSELPIRKRALESTAVFLEANRF